MKIIGLFALALAALPACSPADAAAVSVGGRLRSISYETGPCLGACPTYLVTVNADGTGLFEGRRFTAIRGERRFRISRAQFRAFAARLAPDRPAEGERRYDGPPLCRQLATDQASVAIVWRGAAEQGLYVYYGCDRAANRAMFDRLRAAPDLLPIGDFIGTPR